MNVFRLIVVLLAVALLQSYANATPVPPSAPAPVSPVSPPAPARSVTPSPYVLRLQQGYVCASGRCSRVNVAATQSSKQQGKKPVRLLSRLRKH